jgi:hypothetical protein
VTTRVGEAGLGGAGSERPCRRSRRGGCRVLRFGLKQKNRPEMGTRERKQDKGFCDFEKQQTNEFKCKFEFKHFKIMHQHVCNIKLLGLICFILENIKCLKEIKENLIVFKNKFKVAIKF